ncbi:MAG: Lpg1974 family pore-forming outer membrane protein [Legionellales bacterium]|jgi:hypothetical protein
MKRITHKLFVALSVIAPYAAIAQIATIPIQTDEVASSKEQQITQEQFAKIPKLEGGITAMIGVFYATPSADDVFYAYTAPDGNDVSVLNVDPGYEAGFDVALGYIFENSAQSIELLFRDINTGDTAADSIIEQGKAIDASSDLNYHLRAADVMLGQFIDIGENVQMRLAAGISYAELKQDQETHFVQTNNGNTAQIDGSSEFKGIGPRIGTDVRYGFNQGFGIVGSGSLAYYLGELNNSLTTADHTGSSTVTDNPDNHAVMNFRGNIGIDYIYIFDNAQSSTAGIELGYLIDYYDNSIGTVNNASTTPGLADNQTTIALSFAGPYVNLKAAF